MPMVNHLLFSNNSLIFCRANWESSQQLLSVLRQYALASGQCINTNKTTMVFSKKVKEDVKEEVMTTWGCRGITQYEKYLGLPPIVGRSRKNDFLIFKLNCGSSYNLGNGNSCLKER